MGVVRDLIAGVERARRDYLARVGGLSVSQGEFKPEPSEWCIAEITEHLVHAEENGINLIWSAADGIRRGRPIWSGDPVHRGLPIEAVIEKTWRPKETVPQGAGPDLEGPVGYWATRLECVRPLLERLGRELEGVDLEEVIYPHPISGPLDARQRLEFLRFHLDRHRGQVERVLRAPGFPSS
jgi:hypothetical protein